MSDIHSFTAYLASKTAEYGDRFDPSNLAPQFIPYFHSGVRIRVQGLYITRTGVVGVTTGWKPVFLLMANSNVYGSSDVLTRDDVVIAIKHRRSYVPLVSALEK